MKAKDITGFKFGMLTAILFNHKIDRRGGSEHHWLFRCDCGNEKVIKKNSVISGKTNSCGCYQYGKPIDFVHPESRLSFIRQVCSAKDIDKKHFMAKALYKCSCGTIKEIVIAKAKNGHTISCGCYAKENPTVLHGLHWHPLYKTFYNIKKRCYEESCKAYRDYGGRGVRICEEWLKNPISFVKWGIDKGWTKGLEVDKDIIPKRLGIPALLYSPEMCSIVTRKDNQNAKRNNRVICFNGVVKNISQWSECVGIDRCTLLNRLKKGWSVDETLMTPLYKRHKIKS